ncbi:unnamed protein product [Heligmosomoides polygyrus]|uniref:Ig-like domain-containing protein n=1 Tax=Heligmosomoides polygyrus TaxID=6339 RepID=A0A3P8CAZ9_HELPZ|nr:unnamed protein product [Heligmosomoides polygyrus]
MRFLIGLTLVAAAMACVHKNEKYKDGDTWVVRSTFVMKCRIEANGSWSTKIVGCRTAGGVVVAPGEVIKEGDTTYECTAKSDGRVEIRRTHHFNRQRVSCEGHSLGESWVSQQNFRKSCTESGARITECLTDAGIAVPLNQHLVLSGIIYTVSAWSLASNVDQGVLGLACGSWKLPHFRWVSENKFTKKCTPDGSIIILNCLVDDRNTINVNTEVKLGRSTYKCYRKQAEGRVYFEVVTQ